MDKKVRRIGGQWFDLVVRDQISLRETPRIVVSLKISKKATERNRIKRLLKVAVFKNKSFFEGKNITFIVKANFSKSKSEEVGEVLRKQLQEME
jgi:ribonuclease P protein component